MNGLGLRPLLPMAGLAPAGWALSSFPRNLKSFGPHPPTFSVELLSSCQDMYQDLGLKQEAPWGRKLPEQEAPGAVVSPRITQGHGGWQEATLLSGHVSSGLDAGL